MLDRHVQERAQVVEFALDVGVPKCRVAFASAPEDIALATKLVSDLNGLLGLRSGVGKGVGIAARGGAVHVARVGKQAGSAPEQFDAGALLFGLEHLGHGIEILVGGGKALALRRDVPIVKGVVWCAEFFDELEGGTNALLCVPDRLAAVIPGAQGRADTERVGQGIAEGVPVDHRKAQVFLHGLACHDFILVVPLEGQRIFAVRSFVIDLFDLREKGHFIV